MPNATVMMVENAERFGLAQLHQLRGRIGRGTHPSTCILFDGSEPENEDARTRVEAMVATTDGFELADVDLKLRGKARCSTPVNRGCQTCASRAWRTICRSCNAPAPGHRHAGGRPRSARAPGAARRGRPAVRCLDRLVVPVLGTVGRARLAGRAGDRGHREGDASWSVSRAPGPARVREVLGARVVVPSALDFTPGYGCRRDPGAVAWCVKCDIRGSNTGYGSYDPEQPSAHQARRRRDGAQARF